MLMLDVILYPQLVPISFASFIHYFHNSLRIIKGKKAEANPWGEVKHLSGHYHLPPYHQFDTLPEVKINLC